MWMLILISKNATVRSGKTWPHRGKTKDLKLQKIQTAISKTSAGLISIVNKLMTLGER